MVIRCTAETWYVDVTLKGKNGSYKVSLSHRSLAAASADICVFTSSPRLLLRLSRARTSMPGLSLLQMPAEIFSSLSASIKTCTGTRSTSSKHAPRGYAIFNLLACRQVGRSYYSH